jgi:hypothetical protein
LASWALAPGRWRISPLSTDIQRCEKNAANEGSSRCVGGTIGALGSSDDLCMEGHGGPMCELCVANESHHAAYFDKTEARCKDCPSEAWARAGAIVGGIMGLVVLIYALRCSWRRSQFANCWIAIYLRRIVLYMLSRTVVPRLKIVITFYQIVVVLPSVYNVDMPPEYCERPPTRHSTTALSD